MRLRELRSSGVSMVTSNALASAVGVSGSRVRQDLMAIQMAGRPNAGYPLDELERRIMESLDLLEMKGIALVGYGNLGHALVNSGLWENAGFTLRAIFEQDPEKIGARVGKLKIQPITRLRRVVQNQQIVAACVAVPPQCAQTVVDALVEAGVRGIWNFATTDVRVPHGIVLENQHLDHGLMTLSYLVKNAPGASMRKDESDE